MAQNMRSRWMECALILACAGFIAEVEAKDVGWPREFNADGRRVIVYQPQVDSWKDHNKMVFVAAVEVVPKDAGKSAYGVIRAETDTETNVSDRTVTLSNRKILDLRFPNLPEAESAPLKQSVLAALPPPDWKTMVISLDRVNASLQDATGQQRKVEVNYDPPRIFYSDKPAILVSFIGKPQFKEVPGTGLMAAANTNWDVFLDPATTTYYLLNGDHWLSIKDVKKDKWQAVKDLPAGFARLPQDPNWEDVRKNIPGKPVSAIPKVCVSTTPAELIVTDGDPEFAVIPGTTLLEVTNTDSVLFFHGGERNYYYQVAGRWFRAEARSGPWKVASHDLPEDFKNIPDTDANAFVKATVPGTMEAKDAVILASVPQKTIIQKKETSLEVTYDGSPRFESIKGTSVKYALNSPFDVFLVGGGYYCCSQGVWYAAPKPAGPWVICTQVPDAIYTIPPSAPQHNVTYVYVYDSTPDTVTVGYTSGYSGEYVAATGVLMFGLGMLAGAAIADDWDDHCHGWYYGYHCHGYYYSYGCGAVYHHGYGGYYRAAHCYGPYGGAGRAGYYNPYTGAWARGGYVYGPGGGAGYRAGYNPFTDTCAARAVVKTPYGSSGRFYAERGNKSVWGGHESGARGTVGWAETSKGGQAVGWDTARGQGAVAKDKDGNVYVGKDGNIYKKESDGGWSTNNGGNWESVSKPAPAASTTSAKSGQTTKESGSRTDSGQTRLAKTSESRQTSAETRPSKSSESRPATTSTTDRTSKSHDTRSTQRQLDSEAASRNRGNRNTERASSSWSGSRAGGRSSSGGGSRSSGKRRK